MNTEFNKYGKMTLGHWLFIYGTSILLAPIWIPLEVIKTIQFRLRLRKVLCGTTQEAWGRCANIWDDRNHVYGSTVGPNFTKPFSHSLAEYFLAYHPDSRDFLITQLKCQNPCLAAYAFKAAIRSQPPLQKFELRFRHLETNRRNHCVSLRLLW